MKLEDLIKIFDKVKTLLIEVVFHGRQPSWLNPLISCILLFTFFLLAIWGGLFVIGSIIKIWTEQIRPIYYNQSQKRRPSGREMFATHIEREILQLNSREEWKDYRFTELESEVEAEVKQVGFFVLPFFQSTKRGLRRVQSLSKALELSSERLILVEGEPGSGKSVALRHVAEKLAQSSRKDKSINSVIPLYSNPI